MNYSALARVAVLTFLMQTGISDVIAGELNLGLHLNPTISIPILGRSSVYDKEVEMKSMNMGYNIGANINITNNKISFGTGVNIVHKKTELNSRIKTVQNGSNSFNLKSYSTSFEFPAQLAVNIHQHDRNDWVYNLYLVGGLSYEIFVADGQSFGFTSVNYSHAFLAEQYFDIPQPNERNNWVNIIAGFKINTIIRGFGLIDYGLTYHIPTATNSPYYIESLVIDQGTRQELLYKGDFHPRLSYLNIKLCYYFLNYDHNYKRIKYKSGEYYR